MSEPFWKHMSANFDNEWTDDRCWKALPCSTRRAQDVKFILLKSREYRGLMENITDFADVQYLRCTWRPRVKLKRFKHILGEMRLLANMADGSCYKRIVNLAARASMLRNYYKFTRSDRVNNMSH